MKKIKKNLTPKVERGGFQAKIVWRFVMLVISLFRCGESECEIRNNIKNYVREIRNE